MRLGEISGDEGGRWRNKSEKEIAGWFRIRILKETEEGEWRWRGLRKETAEGYE